jgi:hemerythrin
MYKWTPDLALGNANVDKDHQLLFEMLNQFYDGLVGQGPRLTMLFLIKRMIDYANVHFKNEEILMSQINYPEIEDHIAKHHEFAQKALEYYTKVKDGKLLLTIEVTNYIKDWLTRHIKGDDAKVVIFAKTHQLSAFFHN